MKRRAYLRLLSAAGVTGVAGCSSSGEGSDENGDTETTTAEPTATPSGSIDDAVVALNDAADQLSTGADQLEEFDETSVRESVETARGHLDTAGSAGPSDSEAETITALRAVADYLESMTTVLVAIRDAGYQFETAQRYQESDRFDEAIGAVESAASEFQRAGESLSDARSAFDALDEAAFDRLDATDYDSEQQRIERLGARIETMDPFLDGYAEFIRGYREFTRGNSARESGQYETAADRFDTAAVRFDDAQSAFSDAESIAPAEMRSDAVRLVCYAGALRDGSNHSAAAMRARAEGDSQTAEEELQAAREDFNRCDSGSAALSLPAP